MPKPKNKTSLVFSERGMGFLLIWWRQQWQNYKLSSSVFPIVDASPCSLAYSQLGLTYLDTNEFYELISIAMVQINIFNLFS